MNRRNFISAVASLPLIGLAGCMNNNSTQTGETLDSEEYPEGLTQTGVEDIDLLTSSNSPYLSSESVTISIEQSSGNSTTSVSSKVNSTTPAYRIQSENSFENSSSTVDQYFSEGVVYIQDRTASGSVNYQREQFTFDKSNEYYVEYIRGIFSGVSFSYHTVTDDGLLVYETQSQDDFSMESQFTGANITSSKVIVRFKSDGRFDSIETEIQQDFEEESQQSQSRIQTIQFTNYNNTTVAEPDWLDTAQEEV